MRKKPNHKLAQRPGQPRQLLDRKAAAKGIQMRYAGSREDLALKGAGIAVAETAMGLFPGHLKAQVRHFYEAFHFHSRIGRSRLNSYASAKTSRHRHGIWIKALTERCGIKLSNLDQFTVRNAKLALLAMEKPGPKGQKIYSASTLRNVWTLMDKFLESQGKGPMPPPEEFAQDLPRWSRTLTKEEEQTLASAGVAPEELEADMAAAGYLPESLAPRAFVLLGLRASEFCNTQPARADLGNFYWTVGKGGKTRHIPIESEAQRALIDQMKAVAANCPSGYLTSAKVGPKPTPEQRMSRFRSACRAVDWSAAGLGATPHSGRRDFALDMVERETGEPAAVRGGGQLRGAAREGLARVSNALGHERAEVFSQYGGSVRGVQRYKLRRLKALHEAFKPVASKLQGAGVKSLSLVGPAADGCQIKGPVTFSFDGDAAALGNPEIVSSIQAVVGVPVHFLPVSSPLLSGLPTFEVV